MTLIELLEQKHLPCQLVDGNPEPVLDEFGTPSYNAEELQAEVDAINAEISLQAKIASLGDDISGLIGEYLKQHATLDENASFNWALVVRGDDSGWRINDVPMPTIEQLEVLKPVFEAVVNQEQANLDALKFLEDTDWKVIRHKDQQDLGIATSLTAEEYQELLHQRQMAREAVSK